MHGGLNVSSVFVGLSNDPVPFFFCFVSVFFGGLFEARLLQDYFATSPTGGMKDQEYLVFDSYSRF